MVLHSLGCKRNGRLFINLGRDGLQFILLFGRGWAFIYSFYWKGWPPIYFPFRMGWASVYICISKGWPPIYFSIGRAWAFTYLWFYLGGDVFFWKGWPPIYHFVWERMGINVPFYLGGDGCWFDFLRKKNFNILIWKRNGHLFINLTSDGHQSIFLFGRRLVLMYLSIWRRWPPIYLEGMATNLFFYLGRGGHLSIFLLGRDNHQPIFLFGRGRAFIFFFYLERIATSLPFYLKEDGCWFL